MPEKADGRHDRVLVVDDDPELVRLIQVCLETAGYDVEIATDGEEALGRVAERTPDVILLDVMMPKVDGLEVCRRLRADYETRSTAIILLTAKASSTDKLLGFRAGADDYVTKPFDPDELIERVRATLRRNREMTSLNPLTGLPGNTEIETCLQSKLSADSPFALMHVDIDNFKSYNDFHGVLNGDQAIKLLARCLCQAITEVESADHFVGHVGGDDFAVIVEAALAPVLAQRVIELWSRWAPMLYNQEDVENGYINVLDRRKRMKRFNMMTLSIGIATTLFNEFTSHLEVASVAAEMKELAKRDRGSSFAVDRRKKDSRPSSDPRSVLIVDDDHDTREILRLHCEYLGFHVVAEGANGLEGVALAGEHQPAFVILDQRMPMLEGREAANQIRNLVPQVTIIGFSAVLGDKPIWADEYLSKYDIKELTPFLGRLLEDKQPATD